MENMKTFNQFMAEANTCPICNSEPCTCPGGDNHIEEAEQIDELSKGTLRSYVDKKSDDHESNRNAVADARDALRKHQRNKPSLDAPLKHQFDHSEKKRELEKDVNAASRTATRSNVNILKAKKRLNKEEADKKKENDLPFDGPYSKKKVATPGKSGYGPSAAKHLAKQGMKKAMKEEKDEQEYGYEGAMAITQLKTMMRHAEHMMGMMKEDTDLPEWVQSKITLATDYVQTAHDYLMSEMKEEVEENYVSHAQRKAVWASRNDEKMKKEEHTPSDADLHKTLGPTKNMQQGVEALKKKHGMSDDEAKKHVRRLMGMKEEAKQVDELSTDMLQRYKKKAGDSARNADAKGDVKTGNKRFSGIMKATTKQFHNDLKK
jgi:hypothetical protein